MMIKEEDLAVNQRNEADDTKNESPEKTDHQLVALEKMDENVQEPNATTAQHVADAFANALFQHYSFAMPQPEEKDVTTGLPMHAQLVAAVVAAAAAAEKNAHGPIDYGFTTTPDPASTSTATLDQTLFDGQMVPGSLKRNLMKLKVREDNRARKKRWREHNEERNKDNDLRCRVNKRAHKLFGKEDTPHKKQWVEEEFQRRRAKRQEKERHKQAMDGALHAVSETSVHAAANWLLSQQQQNDVLRHYHEPANELNETHAAALKLNQDLSAFLKFSKESNASAAALVAALQSPQLLQLLTQTAGAIQTTGATSGTNSPPQDESGAGEDNDKQSKDKAKEDESGNGGGQTDSMDAVMTLMQLNGSWRQQ
ncbi:hypothetical protein CLU79DRAFT_754056 [Phycomyces nitens]|nr:hypothetical protein CLU79DRAFT_754056 [Phycomyces nitens]